MRDEQPVAAIVLAGGLARRLGGADKPGLKIGGRTLASTVVAAAIRAGATHVVVVGPERPELAGEAGEAGEASLARVEFTREEPPGGGPVPALRAGLSLITGSRVLLLAADLPFLAAGVLRELCAATASSGTGTVAVDDAGRPQWLVSCWPTADVRAGLADYPGSSLRGLLALIPHAEVVGLAPAGAPPYWLDCDTPEDLAMAGEWAEGATEEREERQ